ncbi:unnamed protein product, partial [Cylicostephanus goldi]
EFLHLNKTAIEKSSTAVTCFYRCFDRADGDDFQLKYGEWIEITILNSMYKSYIFEGMSKVGDNSYPNAVAFLAAKTRAEFGDAYGYFDDRPLIWKDFAQAGYETLYAEDFVDFNLFTYLAKGFRTKPSDHYLR